MKKRILYVILVVFIANVSFAAATFNFSNNSFIYDGILSTDINFVNAPNLNITGCGLPTTRTVTYNYVGVSPTVYASSSIPPNQAGTYTIQATISGGPCDLAVSSTYTYTINPASLTITASSANKFYGLTQGTLIGSTSFSSTGLQNGETIGSVTLNFGVGATAASDPVGSTSVITPSAPIGGTFNSSNYTIGYATGTLTVIPKPITITVDPSQTKVYGASNPGAYTYVVSPSISGLATLNGTLTRVSGEIVGTYAIQQNDLTTANNPNYTIIYIGNNFTITAKPITITVDPSQIKIYGAADPTSYAYTLSAPLIGSDVLTGVLTRATGEAVGQYAINQGTLSNANYDITYVGNNFNITKAPLVITAVNKTKVYGEINPALTVSYAGLVNGDAAPATLPTITTTALESSPVGTYPIIPSAATDPNYTITYVNGSLTVTKAALIIKAKPHTITYNGTAYTGGNGVISTGFASGESISNLNGTLTFGGTSQGAKNAGNYSIIPGGLSSPNYTINYVSDNLEIKKATLNVTVGNQSVEYGTQLAKILSDAQFTYSGFVGGDDATVISGTPTYLTNYTSSIPAGTTGIFIEPKITGLTSNNYDFVAVNGTITITAAPNSYFQIPNAFVPGSSNEFDNKFRIFSNSGFPANLFISLSIYNRNGQFIKRFDSITDYWDGRIGGVLQEADVYLWTARFINDPLTKNIPTSGTFILLK